jgi:GNAT superfamily N-acetyltransferase
MAVKPGKQFEQLPMFMSANERGAQFIGMPLVVNAIQGHEDAPDMIQVHGRIAGHKNIKNNIGTLDDSPAHGALSYDVDNGEISGAHVERNHQRKGIATGLLKYAHLISEKTGVVPEHSPSRTVEAEKWAQTTKHYTNTPLNDRSSLSND